jgi:hypothetical protein
MLVFITVLTRICIAEDYGRSFVLSVFCITLAVAVLSEILSFGGVLSGPYISIFWGAALLVTGALVLWQRQRIPHINVKVSTEQGWFYGAIATLFTTTLVTGLLVTQNNWDSLTYHLTRASHWLQNGDLAFFETSNPRQNILAPLPDLIVAHLLAMDASQRVVTVGQWVCGVAIVVGIAISANLIIRLSGRDMSETSERVFVTTAVVLASTVPMFLAQMSTTQADLVAGVPVAAAGVAIAWGIEKRSRDAAILGGLSVAVAAATKATSVVMILPLFVGLLIILWRSAAHRLHVAGLAVLTAVAATLILSGRHLWNTLHAGDSTLQYSRAHFNSYLSIEVVLTNLVRGGLTQLQGYSGAVNSYLERFASRGLGLLGMDSDLPAATFPYTPQFLLVSSWHEDTVSAPWHLILFLSASVVFLATRAWRKFPALGATLGVIAVQALILAALLRWQPWINRFSFLLILIGSLLSAWLLLNLGSAMRRVVLAAFLISAFVWVLIQPLRGLVGTAWLNPQFAETFVPSYRSPLAYDRFEQQFMHNLSDGRKYRNAIDYALSLNPDELFLVMGEDSREFPLWNLIRQREINVNVRHLRPETRSFEVQTLRPRHASASDKSVIFCDVPCNDETLKGILVLDSDSTKTFGDPWSSITVSRVTPP